MKTKLELKTKLGSWASTQQFPAFLLLRLFLKIVVATKNIILLALLILENPLTFSGNILNYIDDLFIPFGLGFSLKTIRD